jgi:energy-converting hydrogenase Eha subunit B
MRGTPFGNPFILGRDGDRAEVVRRYRVWLWARLQADPGFRAKVRALEGRDLVCCCAPLACHGDVLAAAAAWLAGGGTIAP